MLKISAFYLDKQKSFIPKNIWNVPCLQDSSSFYQQMAPWRLNFPNPRLCFILELQSAANKGPDAGNVWLFFSSFAEAVNCLSKAIEIYTDMGRFTIAAKHHQTIAELYENDIADFERAMQHYEKAADYFRVNIFVFDSFYTLGAL